MSNFKDYMKIRRAEIEDIPAIVDLSIQLGYPTTPEATKDRFLEIQQKQDHYILIAETEHQSVSGWIHVFRSIWLESPPFAELGGLIVDETSRSEGIGKGLLKAAESWAKKQGLTIIRVRSNVIRERAHKFYLREGYQIIKSQHVFEKQLSL
jgi:GNAT superfamily N-acetyltransferase